MLGAVRDRVERVAFQALRNVRRAQRRDQRSVELHYDVLRQAGRADQSEPWRDVVAGERFGNRRHLWRSRRAPRRRYAQHAQSTGIRMHLHQPQVGKHHFDLARHHVRQRRHRALVGNVHHLGVRHALEQLGGETRHAPRTRRSIAQIATPGPGYGDELLHVSCRYRGIDCERIGPRPEVDHRREVFHRIVWKLRVKGNRDGESARAAHRQRIPVRRQLRGDLHADRAARTAAVLDHHRLPPRFSELLADEARQEIVRTGGRERHDQPYRLDGIGLRPDRARHRKRQQRDKSAGAKRLQSFHAGSVVGGSVARR